MVKFQVSGGSQPGRRRISVPGRLQVRVAGRWLVSVTDWARLIPDLTPFFCWTNSRGHHLLGRCTYTHYNQLCHIYHQSRSRRWLPVQCVSPKDDVPANRYYLTTGRLGTLLKVKTSGFLRTRADVAVSKSY
jgi:hypothetical protein